MKLQRQPIYQASLTHFSTALDIAFTNKYCPGAASQQSLMLPQLLSCGYSVAPPPLLLSRLSSCCIPAATAVTLLLSQCHCCHCCRPAVILLLSCWYPAGIVLLLLLLSCPCRPFITYGEQSPQHGHIDAVEHELPAGAYGGEDTAARARCVASVGLPRHTLLIRPTSLRYEAAWCEQLYTLRDILINTPATGLRDILLVGCANNH